MGVLKQWLPYVLSGISAGGQYALIAVGYTMVYGILRLINFAHGDIFMVAGLIMVYLSATMPLYFALPVVVILTVALGFAVERCAYKPLRQAPRMSVMISAIGVSYLLQNLAYYVTGGVPKQYPELPWISDTITILGASTKRVTVITPFLYVHHRLRAGRRGLVPVFLELYDHRPGLRRHAGPEGVRRRRLWRHRVDPRRGHRRVYHRHL